MKPKPWEPKRSGTWDRMSHADRVAWVAGLDDAQILAQAEVRAAATRRTVPEILTAWVLNGLLAYDRKIALVNELHERERGA